MATKTPRDVKADVAERFWLIRLALGLSPKEVSERIDVRLNTYSQWESGARSPGYFDLIRYSQSLGISLDYLLKGDESALTHRVAMELQRYAAEIGQLRRERGGRARRASRTTAAKREAERR